MDVFEEIIEELKGSTDRGDVRRIKAEVCRRHGVERIPRNTEILDRVEEPFRESLLPLLRKKPVRTVSGIAVVAVMARPYPCPHGTCLYCPVGANAPQSYTGREPAAMRARRAEYDPYLQVRDRLNQLKRVGHPIDKVELIVMGGTFLAQPKNYREWFVKRCLDAMNQYNGESKSLQESQRVNERSNIRNVGITFETRPDYAREKHVNEMLNLGVTRVELGVQTLRDEIYEKVGRGHKVKDVVKATRLLKDSGLKVCYHMMPFLFSTLEEDLETFKTIFEDERFRPDALKIYPTLVIKGTKLYDLWKKGEYVPCTDEEAIELIREVKKTMPKWIRTMRIQRDIPCSLIEAGAKKGNLGEVVYNALKEEGIRCRCIRCRDIGHLSYKEGIKVKPDGIETIVETYEASSGLEHFISIEDVKNDALIAYLRLRFPENSHVKEIDRRASMVRELRVLGQMVPLGERIDGLEQHRGWGSLLLKNAEEISLDSGKERILVLSAIGTREYYRKFGYRLRDPYMAKTLT